jgi:transcriptional regulator with XRE-family HTH domain
MMRGITPDDGLRMTKEPFGAHVQRWREKAGINQAELARRAKVSANYISNLERDFSPSSKDGKPHPSVAVVDRIARALGVSLAEARPAAGYARPDEVSKENGYDESEFAVLFHESQKLAPDQKEKFRTIMEMVTNQVRQMLREQDQDKRMRELIEFSGNPQTNERSKKGA